MVKKYKKNNERGRHLRVQHKKIRLLKSKLSLLKHISKKNCALLQYLDDGLAHFGGVYFQCHSSKGEIKSSTGKESENDPKKG